MNLTYRHVPSPDERRAMKPDVGDTVLYEATKYIVTRVGMKYLHARLAAGTTNAEYFIKLTEVVKVPADYGDNPQVVADPKAIELEMFGKR